MSWVLFDELIIRAPIRSVIIYVVCRRFGDKCSLEAVLRGQVLRANLGLLGKPLQRLRWRIWNAITTEPTVEAQRTVYVNTVLKSTSTAVLGSRN